MKLKTILSLATIATLLVLTSCGKEIARLPVNKLSTEGNLTMKETSIDLKKGNEISFWSDMDLEYTEPLELRFRVQISKGDKVVKELELDPFKKNVTMKEVKTNFNGNVSWSFQGKNGTVTIEEDGKYSIKAILISSPDPVLKINKAELVVKI